jgi:hypothetical protein
MAMRDGFPPDNPFPLLLSEHAGEPEQLGLWEAWDEAVISPRTLLKTSILLVTAAPIVFVVLWMANPIVRFANATTSLATTFAPQDGTGQSLPTIRAMAGAARAAPSRDEVTAALRAAFQSQTGNRRQPAEVLLTQFQTWAAKENTNNEVAAAFEPADRSQTETGQPSAEALLTQFQTWAAEEDIRAQAEPVQDTQAQVAQNARAQVRPTQKPRHVRPVQDARAEMTRPVQTAHPQLRREQTARIQDRPAQNAQVAWWRRLNSVE